MTGDGIPELLAALDRHRAAGAEGATRAARRARAAGAGPGRPRRAAVGPGSTTPPLAAATDARDRRRRGATRMTRTRPPTAAGRPSRGKAAMSVERVFVAGAGLMGHGIAQVHAAVGKRRRALRAGPRAGRGRDRDRIAGNLERSVAKGRLTAGGPGRDAGPPRPRPTTSRAAADADLVVEAVFEDLDVKTRLWADLDASRPADAIFASNTSSIAIDTPGRGGRGAAPRPVRRHALLQPGARDAADRAHPRHRDRRRRPRPRSASSPAELGKQVIVSADRPGLHRQPDPDAVPRRGDARLRGGPGHGRGHRHGREGRAQPPDGAARARRLHRPRRVPRHHAGARGRLRAAAVRAAAGARGPRRGGAPRAEDGRGFHTYPR